MFVESPIATLYTLTPRSHRQLALEYNRGFGFYSLVPMKKRSLRTPLYFSSISERRTVQLRFGIGFRMALTSEVSNRLDTDPHAHVDFDSEERQSTLVSSHRHLTLRINLELDAQCDCFFLC